jgi:hypothetical protein
MLPAVYYFQIKNLYSQLGALDGRGFSLPDKEIFRSNPDGLQGKSTRYGGKKAVQTAFSGCECRFSIRK